MEVLERLLHPVTDGEEVLHEQRREFEVEESSDVQGHSDTSGTERQDATNKSTGGQQD